MINNLLSLLTYENIYLVANWGIIPFWLLLIVAPNHVLTNIFSQSIIPFLLLAVSYTYFSYLIYTDGNILDGFELYSGIDGLYSIFANEALLLIFWIHFLAISLFTGAWIVRDSKRYFVPKIIIIPSLILTYFTGPIGLVVYWFFRIFFAKKISFND
tara:strand:+ start:25 stop:495 length:471 start_codon:yes stop_codon:yes gene_type:complete